MAELLPWKAALILLLSAIHCESNPWESTTDVSANEANTTPCPDELAGEKEEKNIVEKKQNPINVHPNTEDTTTLCPEESLKNEDIFAENVEKTLNYLEGTLVEITKNDDKSDSSEENSESTTTICPEELEKHKLELPKETLLKFTEETTDETTICPEELKKRKLGSPESESDNELENEKENAININGNHINNSEQDLSELKAKHSEALLAYSLQDSLKISPTEKEDAPEDRFVIEPATEKLEQASTDGLEELRKKQKAESPETVTRKREENKNHDISVKSLLDVQKDSALLKLVKVKFDPIPGKFLKVEPVNSDKARSKRQAVNYSPYYSGQPSYNPEGVAADRSGVNSNQNTQKSPQPVSYKNYQVQNQQNNSQKVPVGNYNNVRTYQQIHRQYQSLYPNKSYQNYRRPLQSSQNIRRYPSVNKNYYKVKSGGNRRQYQTNARPSSTTDRPIRTNVQKKFRPSPVFP